MLALSKNKRWGLVYADFTDDVEEKLLLRIVMNVDERQVQLTDMIIPVEMLEQLGSEEIEGLSAFRCTTKKKKEK